MDEQRGYRILYVEDHSASVLVMRALLRLRSHVVLHVATTCAHGTDRARALHPALLLLAQHLPDGDGTALLQSLRQVDGCHHVPAIAVTSDLGFAPAGTGFSEVWAKPLHLRSTLQRLDHWMGAARPGKGVSIERCPAGQA